MSDLDELIFRGTTTKECEDFIRSVRRVALLRGKEEDDRWIAHYATSAFAGVALRWFEALDEQVQRDWRKLRKAMLERWSDDGTDDLVKQVSAVSLVPTPPPAAPPPVSPLQTSLSGHGPQSSRAKRGYIRVVSSARPAYRVNGPFSEASRAKDKMLVEIVGATPPYRIKLLDVQGCPSLGLKWKSIPTVEKGSTRRSALVTLYESGKVNSSHSQDELTGPHRAAIWSIARDETIQAWWEDGVTSLMEAVMRESDQLVMFVPDPNAYVNKFPECKRVRLAFEPAVEGASR